MSIYPFAKTINGNHQSDRTPQVLIDRIMRNNSSLIILTLLIVLSGKLGVSRQDKVIKMKVGDSKGSQNTLEIETLGRFAVQEHNKNQNGVLEFVKVLKAKEQVVAGKLYHLTLEAIDEGTNKIYQVKVWVKPWINFKQLQEFKQCSFLDSFRR